MERWEDFAGVTYAPYLSSTRSQAVMHSGTQNASNILLELNNLKTHFHTDEGIVRAVDGASLTLKRGQTLGVLGESGCG